MSSQGFSGKTGTGFKGGNKICDLGKWSLEQNAAVPKYASNCTDGVKFGVAGVEDSKGTIEVKVQKNGRIQMVAGQTVVLQLHVNDTGDDYWEGTAIIASNPVEVDVNEGNPVSMTYNFEGISRWVGHGICDYAADVGCCGSSSGA